MNPARPNRGQEVLFLSSVRGSRDIGPNRHHENQIMTSGVYTETDVRGSGGWGRYRVCETVVRHFILCKSVCVCVKNIQLQQSITSKRKKSASHCSYFSRHIQWLMSRQKKLISGWSQGIVAEFKAVARAVIIIKCMYVAQETEGLTSTAAVAVKRQPHDRWGHVLRSEAPGEFLRM